ncbi:MAG: hypothetical protein AAFO76_07255, partial [Cyanobacteria bacterium J06607_15]
MNLKQQLKQYSKTVVSLATIPGTIALMSAPATVNALEIGDLSFDSIQQLRQVISQSNEPPEVIIGQPDPVPAPPSSTTRNADTRFTCELVNGEYTV